MHLLSEKNDAGKAVAALARRLVIHEEPLSADYYERMVERHLRPRWVPRDDGDGMIGRLLLRYPDDANSDEPHITAGEMQALSPEIWGMGGSRFLVRLYLSPHRHLTRPWEWPSGFVSHFLGCTLEFKGRDLFFGTPSKAKGGTRDMLARLLRTQIHNLQATTPDRRTAEERQEFLRRAAQELGQDGGR